MSFSRFLLIPLLLCSACSPKNQLPPDPQPVVLERDRSDQNIRIEYHSATDQIILQNEQLTHLKMTYFYPENSPTSIPDSSQTEVILDRMPLSVEQVNAFRQLVDLGFFELNDQHGAPETARHYIYSLQIAYEGLDKKVIYRAHPAYEEKPLSFLNVEEALLQMVGKVRRE